MKKTNLFLLVVFALLFCACEKSDDTPTPQALKDYRALIVNQGNFSESNGSLCLYNEADNNILRLAYEKANNGQSLAALVESFVQNQSIGLAICNSPDKIVVVGMDSLQYLSTISGNDVVTPRYGAIIGSYAYITCWGAPEVIGQWPGGYDMLGYPNSYLLKVDLNSKSIVKKISCGGDAEGIIAHNNKLYVAVTDGVKAFDPTTDSQIAHFKHTSFYGTAKHLVADKNGKIWYSVAGEGLGVVNTTSNTVESEVAIPTLDGMSAHIAISRNKDKVLYFSSETDASYNPIKSEIYAVDVTTKTPSTTPIYSGKQLNGIGVSPKTGNIYTAEIWNYGTNSTLKVITESGTLVHEATAGVAASRFVFF